VATGDSTAEFLSSAGPLLGRVLAVLALRDGLRGRLLQGHVDCVLEFVDCYEVWSAVAVEVGD
jgi:hypothetical protein